MTLATDNPNEYKRAFFAALLPTALFWMLCGTIYLNNIVDSSDSSLFLTMSFLAGPLAWFVVAFVLQICFVGRKTFATVNSLCLLSGIYLWVQANLFNWGFGSFDGTPFRISDFSLFIVIEGIIQVILLCVVFIKREWFSRNTVVISFFFLFMQFSAFGAATLYAYRNQEIVFRTSEASWIKYEVKDDTLFQYSADRNIILLVIDSFPGYMAKRLFTERPELKQAFTDFTFFPNCMSFSGGTTRNVPAMLTGQVYDGEAGTTPDFFASSEYMSFLKEAYLGPTSVPKRLKEAGYRVELYPEVRGVIHWEASIADNIEKLPPRPFWAFRNGRNPEGSCFDTIVNAAVFRLCPTLLKKYSETLSHRCIWNIEKTFCPRPPVTTPSLFVGRDVEDPDAFFVSRLNDITAVKTFSAVTNGTSSSEPAPAEVEPSAKIYESGSKTQRCFKYIHLYGTHVPHVRRAAATGDLVYDPANPNASSEFTLEWGYLRWVAAFLETLKKQQLYDDATIIIMGDHPQHYSLTTSIKPSYNVFRSEPHIYNQAMLLVKRAKEKSKKMKVSQAEIRTKDVAGTILAAARITDSGLPSVFRIDRETQESRKIQRLKLARLFGSRLVNVLGKTPFRQVPTQSLQIQSRQPGHSFFVFQFPDVIQLAFFGDEDHSTKRAVLLRAKSSLRSDCYTTPFFKGNVHFSKGERDNNYKFVSTRISRNVWCQHIVAGFEQVPDGDYSLSLLESLGSEGHYREIQYNCIVHILDGKANIEILKIEK